MRLLVVTQAVDRNDPVLGFFCGWLSELAERFEHVHVICLKEGAHTLPQNVVVHSLGKESGRSLIKYLSRFFSLTLGLRAEYDAVFVHMNEEYVLLGGVLWRFLRKRIMLWRNHKKGTWRTRLASHLAHAICYTSPEAFTSRYQSARKMPIGIDTELFAPQGTLRAKESILFLGRLDSVKNPDVFLKALERLEKKGVLFKANLYGDPTPGREEYALKLRNQFGELSRVSFYPGVANRQTPAIYSSHAIYVNLTASGSFDKTIGEAMASGCVVIAANDAVREALEPHFLVRPDDPISVADALEKAISLTDIERQRITQKQREYVEKNHALSRLVLELTEILSSARA